MSTRDFFWGKGGRCVRLTTYHPTIQAPNKYIRYLLTWSNNDKNIRIQEIYKVSGFRLHAAKQYSCEHGLSNTADRTKKRGSLTASHVLPWYSYILYMGRSWQSTGSFKTFTKFHNFSGTRRFIITGFRTWTLLWGQQLQFTSSQTTASRNVFK